MDVGAPHVLTAVVCAHIVGPLFESRFETRGGMDVLDLPRLFDRLLRNELASPTREVPEITRIAFRRDVYGWRKRKRRDGTLTFVACEDLHVRRPFANNLTVDLRLAWLGDDRVLSVKLGRKGSVQVSGCRKLSDSVHLWAVLRRLLRVHADPDAAWRIVRVRTVMVNMRAYLTAKSGAFPPLHTVRWLEHVRECQQVPWLCEGAMEETFFEPEILSCVKVRFRVREGDVVSIMVQRSGCVLLYGGKRRSSALAAWRWLVRNITHGGGEVLLGLRAPVNFWKLVTESGGDN